MGQLAAAAALAALRALARFFALQTLPRKLLCLVLFVGFAAWVVHGFKALSGPAPTANAHPGFLATQPLPQNWRLQSSDIKHDPGAELRVRVGAPAVRDLAGRYVVNPRSKDAALGTADLAAAPRITAASGKFVYFTPLSEQQELASILNTDMKVALCGDDCVESLRVIALWCAAGVSTGCFAALELDKAQLERVAKLKSRQIVLEGN